MKELTRFEIAACKRTAETVKSRRKKKANLMAKIEKLQSEIEQLDAEIMIWEEPIIKMTGGFTSEQVLNGEMEAMQAEVSSLEEALEATVEEAKEEINQPELI